MRLKLVTGRESCLANPSLNEPTPRCRAFRCLHALGTDRECFVRTHDSMSLRIQGMSDGGVLSMAPSPPRRVWTWKRISGILLILLVVCLVAIAGLATMKTESVTKTGIDWYHFTANYQTYEFVSGDFFPTPTGCSTSTTFVCSDQWVALNWSASDGHNMTFQFYSSYNSRLFLLYSSENISFGGYSFWCGPEPRYCGEPFIILTNDTSGRVWTFQWETLFNYTATTSAPIL